MQNSILRYHLHYITHTDTHIIIFSHLSLVVSSHVDTLVFEISFTDFTAYMQKQYKLTCLVFAFKAVAIIDNT